MHRTIARVCAGFALAWAGIALAQVPATYPAKAVRVIVGFPPGSGADITARLIGQKLGESFGQQFVVDNRPGAASNIAAELASKAPPDGHTIFIGTVANTINATLYSRLPFDFVRAFAPVVLASSAANILVVHPSLPVRSVTDLIKLAQSRPGQLNFATSGSGPKSSPPTFAGKSKNGRVSSRSPEPAPSDAFRSTKHLSR